ncbi:MAG: efflux RND transporter permease subunit [Planctomycetota bacterium]
MTRAPLFFRNRYVLVLTIALAIVGGLSALLSMPRLEDPRIVNRNPMILTPFPGASAQRIETLVSEPIENALEEIDSILSIESTSRAGISVVSIELKESIGEEDKDAAFSEIRDKIGDVQPFLPPGAGPMDFDDKRDPVAYTRILAVSAPDARDASPGLLGRVAEELADRLRAVPNTELVRLYGEAEEELRVRIDRDALSDLALTVPQIAARIERADSKGSAGVLRSETSDVLLEVRGELDSVARVREVPIVETDDGSVVRVGDVALVDRAVRTPRRELASTDGVPSVIVAARMGSGARADAWARAVDEVVDRVRTDRAGGLDIATVFDQERYTSARLIELGGNLLAGVVVIIFVVWLTMGIRQALIIGSALPLVVGVTLVAIQASGNSLHQMSIFGMIIALGLLIDNAIVVTDEVSSRIRKGLGRAKAVSSSMRHLFGPLLASTLTTVFAFAPILLLPGGAGDFVGSIGQSVIYAVTISFALSMTVIAALAGIFTPSAERPPRWWRDGVTSKPIARRLESGLRRGLRAPVALAAIAMSPALLGFVLARTLGDSFFPPVDRDMLHVQLWMGSETSSQESARLAERAESIIRELDGVERVHWLVGASFPSVWYNLIEDKDGQSSFAHAVIETKSMEATKRLVRSIQASLDDDLPEAQTVTRQFGQGPPVVADIEYRVIGPDTATLQAIGEELRLALKQDPDVLHTQMTMERAEPKLWIDVDEDAARVAGLTLDDVAEQVASMYEGATGGSVLEQLEEMPVRVSALDAQRGSLRDIASTVLIGPEREWVPLPSIARIELRPERGAITRYNGERSNTIKAYTAPGALAIDIGNRVLAEHEAASDGLPVGYRIELGGAAEQDADATGNLMLYLPILVTLMAAVLILAFKSVALAGVLAIVALLSVGLAMLATWAIQFPISFNTILGTLGLIGVALNDSIVVLAAIREDPRARAGDPDAIARVIMGCLRHVVSTTLTTIGGFLPLLLFVGGDFWPSLAIVMAGGIGGATLIAVLFIPSAYRIVAWMSRLDRAEPDAPAQALAV